MRSPGQPSGAVKTFTLLAEKVAGSFSVQSAGPGLEPSASFRVTLSRPPAPAVSAMSAKSTLMDLSRKTLPSGTTPAPAVKAWARTRTLLESSASSSSLSPRLPT